MLTDYDLKELAQRARDACDCSNCTRAGITNTCLAKRIFDQLLIEELRKLNS